MSSPSRPASHALMMLVDVLALEQRLDQLQLLLRLRVARDELEPVGRDDRQVGHPPLLPLLVVLLGLGELDEMADGPRDHVVVGLEEDGLVARGRPGLRLGLRGLDDLFVRRLFGLLLAALRLDVVELAALEGTVQRAREVAADRGLFCDDEGLRHQNTIASSSRMRSEPGPPGDTWPRAAQPLLLLRRSLSWPVLKGLYRLRAQGEENLPADGGYVLAANHISNFDPWPLGHADLARSASCASWRSRSCTGGRSVV